jgi:predicted RNA-binding Zn-ribbon protein involved in translation (DUF1610 family)
MLLQQLTRIASPTRLLTQDSFKERPGITVELGRDRCKDLLQPKLGLGPDVFWREGQQLIVFRPHLDFGGIMPGSSATKIPCPQCKTACLTSNGDVGYLRAVVARDRTMLLLGHQYTCTRCEKGAPSLVNQLM